MLANLPMYDLPEVRAATDDWWRGVAAGLRGAGIGDAPRALDRDLGEDIWRSTELLLSQTCGYPLTHELAGVVELVATPAYAAQGCRGPEYASLLIVADDSPAASPADLRGTRCAFSRRDSHSGYNVLRVTIAPLARGGAFFSETLESGAHARSIALVASRRADVCAVDCVTHALMARHAPAALEGTRVLCETARAPGLPYVTRAGIGVDRLERLRDGVRAAFADPALAATREALLLAGVEFLPLAAYRRIDDMEKSARDAGYGEIH